MPTIYLIPGMACDARLFDPLLSFLKKADFNYEVLVHLEPFSIHESVADYAKRLSKYVTGENNVVIGVSLGGLIGIELSRHIPLNQLITISSVRDFRQVPSQIRFLRYFPIHRFVPTQLSKWFLIHGASWFNIINKEYTDKWSAMVHDSSLAHLKWGRHQVIHWRGEKARCEVFRIIGDKDHIFSNISQQDIVIQNGTHAMVLNQAEQIAKNILEVLKISSKTS